MPTFDVVSKVDWSEVKNAVNQAQREISQRFDFRGTDTTLEHKDQQFLITSSTEERAKAAYEVLQQKLIRRKVSLKHLDPGEFGKGSKGQAKLPISVKEGIDRDKASEIVKRLKGSKLKVQAAIVEDAVRVSGKKKDDLQQAIALLKGAELNIELQYVNFRD